MMHSEKIIEVVHLAKTYGHFEAVKDVNFEVHRGDIFGFLGPNGAGKSTTIRCLLSLIRPTSGHIRLFDLDIRRHRKAVLSRTGCLVEKPDFYEYLSARRNLEIFSRISGRRISGAGLDAIIDFVGLSGRGHDKVAGFSHGMKQRLGLAQALIHEPELIILDEPGTGLDPQGMNELRRLLTSLSHDHGKTIVLSSHQLNEIELIANRMVIIHKGKTLVQGEVESLLNQSELLIRMEVTDSHKAMECLQMFPSGVQPTSEKAGEIQFTAAKSEIPEVHRLLVNHGVEVYTIQSRRQLEEYFLNLTSS